MAVLPSLTFRGSKGAMTVSMTMTVQDRSLFSTVFELEKVDDVDICKPAEDEMDAIVAHVANHVVGETPGEEGRLFLDPVQLNASVVISQEEPVAPLAPDDPCSIVVFLRSRVKRGIAFSRHRRYYLRG